MHNDHGNHDDHDDRDSDSCTMNIVCCTAAPLDLPHIFDDLMAMMRMIIVIVMPLLIIARWHLWSFRELLMTIAPSRTNLVIFKYFHTICRDDNEVDFVMIITDWDGLTIIDMEHKKLSFSCLISCLLKFGLCTFWWMLFKNQYRHNRPYHEYQFWFLCTYIHVITNTCLNLRFDRFGVD